MAPQVFEGVKIADFSWVGVGPISVKYLADHGATVVHVESASRPDTLRRAPPLKDNEPGINRSGFFADYNSSKYGLSLNLNHPKGREIARRLVRWADVVAESYTPPVMSKWGLDYESVRVENPDIVYFSTCQLGHDGPYAGQRGYGTQLVSLAGFTHLTGWPDRPPAGPYGAYTDFINPRFGALAMVAALDYHRRTGKGLYIDQSQLEGGVQFLAPLLLDFHVNGRDHTRAGNRDPVGVPHNAYPCRGQDRWCVISVFTDAEWLALCHAMGNPAWAQEERFSTVLSRKHHEEELDQLMSQWTLQHTAEEVMAILQAAGVAAGVVQTAEDLFEDPQLKHRGHFVIQEHSEIGPHAYDGISFKLSRTPGRPRMPAPCLGEHNELVLRGLLGYGDEEIADLIIQGVLE